MPTSVLTRGRKIVARLTALAMVASIMVIGALPASAEIDTSATCPASTPSAGFTDIAGQPAHTQLAINCIADYGIAQGFTATTFVPQAEVSRWQMALFLTRQATVHGLTLGDGSDQGFTDIGDYPASTQLAINQLAQLEITTGTTATTYSPAAPVTRWQMALFLTRLLDAAGVTLGDGSPQGFTDISAFPVSTQVAINQIAQAEVSEGFNATTFGPALNTLRSQMALFLTRTLAADGITPTPDSRVVVTPSASATQGDGTARSYTATVTNDNDTDYAGQVIIRLLDANADGTPNGTTAATGVNITHVDGVALGVAATSTTAFAGVDGSVTFLVRHSSGASADAVPQVIRDTDSDGNVDAGEERGLGGAVFFTFTASEITVAENTAAGARLVCSTDKANDRYIVDISVDNDCNSAVGVAVDLRRVEYDANDVYLGDAGSMTAFEAALSVGDTVTASPYSVAADGQSSFTLSNVVTPLSVTSPGAPLAVDADTRTIAGSGNPGWEVVVYRDQSTADVYEPAIDPAASAVVTVSADGAWSTTVSLAQNAANNFIAVQRSAGSSTTSSAAGGNLVANPNVADVPTITESPSAGFTLTTTSVVEGAGADNNVLDPTDVITFVFSENVADISNGASITVTDGDGTIATLTVGTNVTATRVGVAPSASYTFTLTGFPTITTTGGTAGVSLPAQITASTGIVDATDGTALSFPASSDRIINE